jgi:hypothetical protein
MLLDHLDERLPRGADDLVRGAVELGAPIGRRSLDPRRLRVGVTP